MGPVQIYIASDHAGFALKAQLISKLKQYDWLDLGTKDNSSVDYPDFAEALSKKMKLADANQRGILICGSGQGMAMKANRYPWLRAALCWNMESAQLARAHNDANVLCLSSRLISAEVNEQIVSHFMSTNFEGGRHIARVDKLSK